MARASAIEPGVSQQVPAADHWSELETWVWKTLPAGEVANITRYAETLPAEDLNRPAPADPRKPEDWRDGCRRLTVRFLEEVLFGEPYQSTLHRKGLRIEGGWFDEEIDLEWAEVPRQIWLERCRFERSVLLSGLRTQRLISLERSMFVADLKLWVARLAGHLSLDGAGFNQVDLRGARVGGQVSPDRCRRHAYHGVR